MRSDELSRWFSGTPERHLATDVVELAVAFGWGSYHASTLSTVWGPALEQRLAADWERAHPPQGAAWMRVVGAVRHGWERASAGAAGEAGSPGRAPPRDPSS